MYKKILVPIDGSAASKRGLDEAIRLARHHKSRLRLIHVGGLFILTPVLTRRPYVGDVQKILRESGSRILRQAEALAHTRGVAADALMLEIVAGSVASEIVKQAKKWRAELIVMASHRRKGLEGLLLGSETHKVLVHSRIPVLVVR